VTTAARVAESKPESKAAPTARRGVRGSLRLNFERDESLGQTVLAATHQEPPLKVVRAFSIEDGAALVHLHNVSGGLLGGDDLEFTVSAGAGSQAQITTTGATRIYRAREDGATTTMRNEITVGEDALLEYLPDPTIPYANARFRQHTVIRLAQSAGLFWWEILAPGREARGEIFEYESIEMKTDVVALGRPIIAERARLEPKKRGLSSLARLGTYRTWATFYICRVGLSERVWLDLENELRAVTQRFVQPGETLWGISTLVAHGLVVRCVAKHGRNVLPGLHAIWDAAKSRLYGRSAVPPRKVN
jgi:urease accessory protein